MSEESKTSKCTICRKPFACHRYVVMHMARVHSKAKEDLKPLECSICGKNSPRLSHLQCHQLMAREWHQRARKNTHRSFKCQHCGEISNGYASLKAHEMRQRAQSFVCSCGASFSRQSELRAHRNACRKRGSFLCLVCERLFTQRVQLDRYWKKEHFVNAQCTECGWIAAAPLRKAEHALEVDKNDICGYCGVEEPSIDHVSAVHLKRLKESISVRQTNKKQDRSSSSRADTPPSEATDAPFNVEEDQKQPCEEALRREAFPVIRPVGADAKADRLLSEYFWLIFQNFGSISFNSNGALKSSGFFSVLFLLLFFFLLYWGGIGVSFYGAF